MKQISFYKEFSNTNEQMSLDLILSEIKEGKYKIEVDHLRSLVEQGKEQEFDSLKRNLPGFTPSGLFKGSRKLENLESYTQIIVLDFDNLSEEEYENSSYLASTNHYTLACFQSPSGQGLKILVEVNSGLEDHERAFNQVADYYEEHLGLSVDLSGKDITRLCFMSYDPWTFINPDNIKFEVKQLEGPLEVVNDQFLTTATMSPEGNDTFEQLFVEVIELTDNKLQYVQGNRNNYIHLLACNCNRFGMPEDKAMSLILEKFDLDPKEIIATVKSVYKINKDEFAQSAQFARIPFGEHDEADIRPDDELEGMPTIPQGVYECLPELLYNGCKVFESGREKDIFLTGSLAILSGCFTAVHGTYDQKTIYPNIYCFIIAPAASGKGELVFSKALGQAIHNKLINASSEAHARYQAELQEFKLDIKKRKEGDSPLLEPTKPPFRTLFIPGNSSSAAVIKHLNEGQGIGIFCETEADTIGNTFKQDWGGFSDLLRKAFHHENISYSRKTNSEYFEVDIPKLSVALSGTPSQVGNIISSPEDGMFSRFIFYCFKVKPEWRDVSPSEGRINLNSHFEGLSNQVLEIVEFLDKYPAEFVLTKKQWEVLQDHFKKWLKEVNLFVGEEATSTVKRLGLILYRIAMIFTALRKFEKKDINPTIVCEDSDFQTAFSLIEVYKVHAIEMFRRLPKAMANIDKRMQSFFDDLPANFQRKEALAIGKSIGMGVRTIDKYLSRLFNGGLLTHPDFGQYSKV